MLLKGSITVRDGEAFALVPETSQGSCLLPLCSVVYRYEPVPWASAAWASGGHSQPMVVSVGLNIVDRVDRAVGLHPITGLCKLCFDVVL